MKVSIYAWAPSQGLTQKTLAFAAKKRISSDWHYGNFGDLFNFDLVKWLYGLEAKNTYFNSRALFVGSTIHLASKRDFIFGAGLKTGRVGSNFDPRKCLGLRGLRSVEKITESKGRPGNIGFIGDPGILAKNVFGEPAGTTVLNKSIYIPHYRDSSLPEGLSDHVRVVNADSNPEDIAMRIAGSDRVYSSSLHGLIFAHSFNKPAFLLAPRSEPIFKYLDYLWYLHKWEFTNLDQMNKGGGFEIPAPPETYMNDLLRGLPELSELKSYGLVR